jgi:hypothetical protein
MKQVKLFEANSKEELETLINNFMAKLRDGEFIGINYMSPTLKDTKNRYDAIWSCMVCYRK